METLGWNSTCLWPWIKCKTRMCHLWSNLNCSDSVTLGHTQPNRTYHSMSWHGSNITHWLATGNLFNKSTLAIETIISWATPCVQPFMCSIHDMAVHACHWYDKNELVSSPEKRVTTCLVIWYWSCSFYHDGNKFIWMSQLYQWYHSYVNTVRRVGALILIESWTQMCSWVINPLISPDKKTVTIAHRAFFFQGCRMGFPWTLGGN